MTERFENLYRLPSSLVLPGCPVAIETGALLKDTQTGKVLAQLKLLALTDKVIKAVKVHFDVNDALGSSIEGPADFQYNDVNICSGNTFGSQVPIFFPNENARSFTVKVTALALEDGEIWRNTANSPMGAFPPLEPLSSQLKTNDLFEQYKMETTPQAAYLPVQYRSFWRCTCGRVNAGTVCTKCGLDKENLIQATNLSYLTERLENRLAEEKAAEEARLAKEKAEAEEKARIKRESDDKKYIEAVAVLDQSKSINELENAKKTYDSLLEVDGVFRDSTKKEEYEQKIKKLKKKKKTRTILLVALLLILVGGGLFGYYVGYPYYLRYSAESSVKNHDYATAIKYYEALKSPDDVTATLYKQAGYYLEQGQYDDAISAFTDLGDYEDSKDMVKQSTYQKGMSLLEAKSYKDAIKVFSGIANYSDAGDRLAQARYEQALVEIESKNYKEALSYLKDAGKAAGAKEKTEEVHYIYGHELMEAGKYSEAADQFSPLMSSSKYEDGKALYHECCYKGGLAAIDAKDYKKAIALLNAVKNDSEYGDANAKLNEAKYLYVLGHKSSNDSTTFQYLKDLKNIGYADSYSIYNNLYQWTVDIYAVNSSSSSKTNTSSISRRDYAYAHFRVSGGPPSGTIKIRIAGYLPNTDGPLYSDYINCSRGTDNWYSVYYTTGGASGTGWFKAYDENGNLLDTITFNVY